MIVENYKKVVINILHFLNYNQIGNPNGTNHRVINLIDLALAFIYAVISVWKLETVTGLVLIVNLLTLSKMIISNWRGSINWREQYEEKNLTNPGLLFKTACDFKIIIELCVIAFTLVPFALQGIFFDEYVVRGFAGAVICLSFVESFINVHVELFKAKIDLGML